MAEVPPETTVDRWQQEAGTGEPVAATDGGTAT